jgi:hypothetical protein
LEPFSINLSNLAYFVYSMVYDIISVISCSEISTFSLLLVFYYSLSGFGVNGAVGASFSSCPCSGIFGSASFLGPGEPIYSVTGFSSVVVAFLSFERLEVVLVLLTLLLFLPTLIVAFFFLSLSEAS